MVPLSVISDAAAGQEYFRHLEKWHIVVCKDCQYGVWPSHVKGHLTGKQHKIAAKEAQQIAEEVEEWPGIIQFPSEFEFPAHIEEPIPELPLFEDGWKCRLEPEHCHYICRDKKTIKNHWRTRHQ